MPDISRGGAAPSPYPLPHRWGRGVIKFWRENAISNAGASAPAQIIKLREALADAGEIAAECGRLEILTERHEGHEVESFVLDRRAKPLLVRYVRRRKPIAAKLFELG